MSQTFKLNDGNSIPAIGFGVFLIPADGSTYEAVKEALAAGYRHIDTAQAYFNEAEVGRAIADSGIPREDIYVTTKLWLQDYAYDLAVKGLNASLEKLALDYIDLYVLHQPIGDIYGAWRYLTEAYKEGKIRAIGVDNFTQAKLVEFIKFNEVKPAVNLIQANPYHQRHEDHAAMVARDVQMVAWQPFSAGDGNLFEQPILKEIAAAHDKTVAQVILRWLLQRDIVTIPKSINPERLAQNLAVFDFELTAEDMEAIKSIDQGGGFALPENADNFERILNMWEQMFG